MTIARVREHHGPGIVEENVRGHAAEMLERALMALEDRVEALMREGTREEAA